MPQAETSSAAVTSDRHRRGGVTIQICSPDDPDCEPPPPPPPSTTETVGWHFNLYSFGESIANAIATYGQPNGSGVGVAIIANGINCVNQPDFIQPCAGGVDFSGAGDPFYDPVGGTTGMASLLLAEANNSFGIRGIAPRVSLYAVKIANNCLSAAQAFDYINYNLPDVSIIITGHYRTAQTLADQQAYEAQCAGERDAVLSATAAGLLIVSGAGITAASDDSVTYPARLPGVAAVGGFGCASFSGGSICNSGPRYAPLSARGRQVAFAAAFEHLPVLYPGSGTPQVLDGPWYAAATAGGIAALVHERYNLSRKGQCVLERVTVVGGCRGAGRAWR
ncbi:MAG: S8 family serine peptidase, partial [Gemmatimonadaceae bacterium]